jgi:hypothetical protein
MKKFTTVFGLALFCCTCTLFAQSEIEAKLSGSTGSEGFNVKNSSGTSLFRVGGDGKVGIGTASPAAALDVGGSLISGSHRLAAYNSKIELMGTGKNGKYWTLDPVAFVDDQFGIIRYESNAAVTDKSIILTNAGNLGIGMSSPAQKLVVKQTVADLWAGNFFTSGVSTGASYGLVVSAGTNGNDVSFQARNQAGTSLFSISGDGGVSAGSNVSATGNSMAIGTNVTASGATSFAAGINATASGPQSVALGSYVSTNNMQGAFVLGDLSTTTEMSTSKVNQFKARFSNGYHFYTNYACSTGVYLLGNASAWTTVSDRNRKENLRQVDGETILSRIRALQITEWSYKNTDSAMRYIGPMAQDFWQAFHLGGTDSLGINSQCIDGVNMAAVQALEARTATVPAMQQELTALREQLAGLRSINVQLANEMKDLRTTNAQLTNDVKELRTLKAEVEEIRQSLAGKGETDARATHAELRPVR